MTSPGGPPLYCIVIVALFVLGYLASLGEAAMSAARRSYGKKWGEKASRRLAALQFIQCFSGIAAGIAGLRWPGAALLAFFRARLTGAFLAPTLAFCIPAIVIALSYTLLCSILPKTILRSRGVAWAARLEPLIVFLGAIAAPFAWLLTKSALGLLKILKIEAPSHAITEDDLRLVLMEGEESGIVESKERTMVEGVFYLGDRPVGAFMQHRSEITLLEINAGENEVKALVTGALEQRCFPVTVKGPDDVAGVVAAETVLLALLEEKWPGLKKIMEKPLFIPETMSALKAFEVFKKGNADYILVMDEYGGLAGSLSVGDLVKEIIGELSAESPGEEEILLQEDGSYLVDGMVNIDELTERLAIRKLPGEHNDYHTLAGLILELAESIPKTGDSYEWEGFRFKVVDMDGNRIDKVLIHIPEKQRSLSPM